MSALTVHDVHAWVEAAQARWASDLQFRELRRGVQAVSDLYVHKRATHSLSDRAVDGRGKRAAFAVYYGGLHLTLLQAWLAERDPVAIDQVWDPGCGPGVVGAAVARWGACKKVHASDRVGRHLEVAAWTGRQLGVRTQTRKAELPRVLERTRGVGIVTLGWVLNELDDSLREATLTALIRRLRAGSGVLILAPLSLRASPWWPQAVQKLRAARPDACAEEYRLQPELAPLLADLDRASRLNHRTMGARVFYAPPQVKGRSATA